jgi:hypothetical protein
MKKMMKRMNLLISESQKVDYIHPLICIIVLLVGTRDLRTL